MPETDNSGFITYKECHLISSSVADKIEINTETNEKIIRILQGNGEGGLIWKVNTLMLRNQWLDKGTTIVVGIASSLITLYVAGVLHL